MHDYPGFSTRHLESPHDPAERTVTLIVTVTFGSDDPDEDGRDIKGDVDAALNKAGIDAEIEIDGVSPLEEDSHV